jgi:cobalt-precorrin-5B (C1)-methyltransferase
MDNDDPDVTRGAIIEVQVAASRAELELNPRPHRPYVYGGLHLYAGRGVGVVTRPGLKPPVGYPAINPVPREAIEKAYRAVAQGRVIHCAVGIERGETIALQTANPKVGIVGGLSILGTTGWVKPVSNVAFIEAIRSELQVIAATHDPVAVLTLGNRASAWAHTRYAAERIVTIGNAIDAVCADAEALKIRRVVLVAGAAKMAKIAQGFSDTHARYGSLDLKPWVDLLRREWGAQIDTGRVRTLKGVYEQLDRSVADRLDRRIEEVARRQLTDRFGSLQIKTVIVR